MSDSCTISFSLPSLFVFSCITFTIGHSADRDGRHSGGLEMLFSDQRRHSLSVPVADKDGRPSSIAYLIDYLCKNTMKDSRKELFVLDSHLYVSLHCNLSFCSAVLGHSDSHTPSRRGWVVVSRTCTSIWQPRLMIWHFSRPGILVLINDADWELEGEEAYEIQAGDNILFVSTLHGG